MSSVSNQSTATSFLGKRSFLLRTGSIQKIKCTATYPFRLAGLKLNRDAIKALIETTIIRARLFSQVALLNMYILTCQLLGTILSPSVIQYANKFCDKNKKTDLSFQQRLLNEIQRLENHKDRLEPKPEEIKNTAAKCTDKNMTSEQILFRSEIAKFQDSTPGNAKQNHSSASTFVPKTNDLLLAVTVYFSAIFIYLQLLFLTIILNTTRLPPGLIFLISSLLLIAYIAFRVFFVSRGKKTEIKKTSKDSHSARDAGVTSSMCRQSRPRFKKVIDFDSKTLSKIKLL